MAPRKLRIASGRMRDMQASSNRTRAPGAGRAEFRIAARCGAGSNSGLESLERSRRRLVRSFNLEFEMADSGRYRRGVRDTDCGAWRTIMATGAISGGAFGQQGERSLLAGGRTISSRVYIANSRTSTARRGHSGRPKFDRASFRGTGDSCAGAINQDQVDREPRDWQR